MDFVIRSIQEIYTTIQPATESCCACIHWLIDVVKSIFEACNCCNNAPSLERRVRNLDNQPQGVLPLVPPTVQQQPMRVAVTVQPVAGALPIVQQQSHNDSPVVVVQPIVREQPQRNDAPQAVLPRITEEGRRRDERERAEHRRWMENYRQRMEELRQDRVRFQNAMLHQHSERDAAVVPVRRLVEVAPKEPIVKPAPPAKKEPDKLLEKDLKIPFTYKDFRTAVVAGSSAARQKTLGECVGKNLVTMQWKMQCHSEKEGQHTRQGGANIADLEGVLERCEEIYRNHKVSKVELTFYNGANKVVKHYQWT